MLKLLLVSALVGGANGLFFHIKQGEVKCFVEEVPDETMVSGESAQHAVSSSHHPLCHSIHSKSFSTPSFLRETAQV